MRFPVVFIAGLEEGLFRTAGLDIRKALEEERRLAYGGIPGARAAFLAQAWRRATGQWTGVVAVPILLRARRAAGGPTSRRRSGRGAGDASISTRLGLRIAPVDQLGHDPDRGRAFRQGIGAGAPPPGRHSSVERPRGERTHSHPGRRRQPPGRPRAAPSGPSAGPAIIPGNASARRREVRMHAGATDHSEPKLTRTAEESRFRKDRPSGQDRHRQRANLEIIGDDGGRLRPRQIYRASRRADRNGRSTLQDPRGSLMAPPCSTRCVGGRSFVTSAAPGCRRDGLRSSRQ